MLGNEAIARGAYEAGVKVTSAYPGTPSTEVSENVVKYKEIYAEWAPNEKVATEVAIGASMAGVRSMTMMKMVGLNVASDPLFTAGYIGVNGGMVLVVADDPGIYSSQNEQDTRMIARAAMVPVVNLLIVKKQDILQRGLMNYLKNMIHRLFLEQLHVLHIHRGLLILKIELR